jgi:hypothetical protein
LTSAVPNFILFFLGNWGFLNIVGKAFSNFDRGVPLSRKKYLSFGTADYASKNSL